MPIIEPAIRPPAEAESFLLQITTGCSSNYCTFCGAYQNKVFAVKPQEEIETDIAQEKRRNPLLRRVFLMDGDALVVNNERLIPILRELNSAFPFLSRIASYANGYNITQRTPRELQELYDHKLRLIYIGLESGNQEILDLHKKRSGVNEMIEAVLKAKKAGIKASVIVLLGLGGKKYSLQHVRDSISALNKMQPKYLSFLSLMLIPGTPLWEDAQKGTFEELHSKELLKEAHDIIKGLELTGTIFRSNHASNYLALEGRFPKDKNDLLKKLEAGISGKAWLKPEFLRGL